MNKRIIDLEKDNMKYLYNLIKNDKYSWFKEYCPSCIKQREEGGWCFPIDDDRYRECGYVEEYFKKIHKVDIDEIRFIEIEEDDISTIKCFKEV